MSAERNPVPALWFVLPLVALTLTAAWMPHYLLDDSFISFRYARNLVEGHGLVFNPGERVEGYTNFLWILAVAAAMRLGFAPEAAAVVLGLACAVAALIVTHRLCATLTPRRWQILAPTLLGCSTPFVFWAFSGMETIAFAFLVTLGAYGTVRQGDGGGLLLAPLALALACLTRPDGAIALGVSLAAVLAAPGPRPRRQRLWVFAAVAGAILLPYLGWKLWYYGDLIPNTFHAKVGGSLDQAVRGLRYLGNFLIFACATGAFPAALLAVPGSDWRRAYLLALVVLQTAYVVAVGGDSFLFYRFLVPILPILAVLTALGFERIFATLSDRFVVPAWLAALALAPVLLAAAGYAHQGHYRDTIRDKTAINGRYAAIAAWLEDHAGPTDAIAVIAAGIIPYYSELPAIDMIGLTDRHIARRRIDSMGAGMAGHEKGDGAYVFSRRPRYILIHPITTREPIGLETFNMTARRFVSTRELWLMPEFHRLYEHRSVALDGFYFHYFERREP